MRSTLRVWLDRCEWGVVSVGTVLAALRTIYPDPGGVDGAIKAILIGYLHSYYAVGVLVGTGLVVGLKTGRLMLDHFGTDKKAIKAVLDSGHQVYFRQQPRETANYHRVTLFRARRHVRDCPWIRCDTWELRTWKFWQWQWGWRWTLRMVARSGTAYQHPCISFTVDTENEDRNEGVCGRAWFMDATCTEVDLPDWATATPAGRAEYAERSRMALEKAAALRVKSRSLSAHVVRRKGVRWGVVVFDSREPNGVDGTTPRAELIAMTAMALGHLV